MQRCMAISMAPPIRQSKLSVNQGAAVFLTLTSKELDWYALSMQLSIMILLHTCKIYKYSTIYTMNIRMLCLVDHAYWPATSKTVMLFHGNLEGIDKTRWQSWR